MKTAQEIINTVLFPNHTVGFQKQGIIDIMKQYAELCVEQALEDASKCTKILRTVLDYEGDKNSLDFTALLGEKSAEIRKYIQSTTIKTP